MELRNTNHSYYCNDANYYSNKSLVEFKTWEDFKSSWLNEDLWIDHDYSHCFRFDIKSHFDTELDEEIKDKFSLHLYMMLQRKGNFIPILINEITENDMQEIERYLTDCWKYLKNQWAEFSK